MPDIYEYYFSTADEMLRKGQGGFFAPSREAQMRIFEFQHETPIEDLGNIINRHRGLSTYRAVLTGQAHSFELQDQDRYEIAHLLELYGYVREGMRILPEPDTLRFSNGIGMNHERLRRYMITMARDVTMVYSVALSLGGEKR